MQITLLGTSGMIPTKERNVSGVFLSYKNEGILFDCGEGTQRQLKKAGINLSKVTKICITHWHGDHVLGLPGLIQSLGASDYTKTLELCGPTGTKEFMKNMEKAFVFDRRINMNITEVKQGMVWDTKDFIIECAPMIHRTTCVGYAFVEKDTRKINMAKVKKLGIPAGPHIGKLQEGKTITFKGKKISPNTVSSMKKGRRVCFITDTRPNKGCYLLAKDADLLICESTYKSDLEEKAKEYTHLTAVEAGQIASQAGAKKLVLTHFSARYKDEQELEADARTVFDNTFAGKDLMKINL